MMNHQRTLSKTTTIFILKNKEFLIDRVFLVILHNFKGNRSIGLLLAVVVEDFAVG
jgi:hypothetical protein